MTRATHTSDPDVESVEELLEGLRVGRIPSRDLDLSGADLSGLDLSGLALGGADLRRARLIGADLSGAVLGRIRGEGADFTGARLSGADLTDAALQGASLGGAQLDGASLRGAKLESVVLSGAQLTGADLTAADLTDARLIGAGLEQAIFEAARLDGADLSEASVAGASFVRASFARATLGGVGGYRDAQWILARVEDAERHGAHLLCAHVADENFIHEFRNQSRRHELVYRVWHLTSDCGRNVGRWVACCALIALLFAGLYSQLDIDFGDHETWLSPLYFSVVTLTTLGYGDALPTNVAGQVAVMVEVVLGYVFLGGLLTLMFHGLSRSQS